MKTFSSADKNWAVQISTVKGSACAKTKKALPIRKLTIEKHTNNKKVQFTFFQCVMQKIRFKYFLWKFIFVETFGPSAQGNRII